MGIQIENEVDNEVKIQPLYKVLLHNDDVNDMGRVVGVLMETFKFEFDKCFMLMMEAHECGVALCKVEPLEHAEFHMEQLQSFGLVCTIEPE